MADWYVSSVAYAALPAWAPSPATYTVGQIIRPLAAPAVGKRHPQRCTTAGTSGASEPTWGSANNATTTSGTAVFTNVAGQSAYGWGAAAGDVYSLSNAVVARPVVGDRVFVSSDSVDNAVGSTYNMIAAGNSITGSVQLISVNRAGSVPPVAADIQAGASIIGILNSNIILDAACNHFWQGFTFTVTGTGVSQLRFNSGMYRINHLKDCAIVFTNTNSVGTIMNNNPSKVIWDNVTVQFGHIGQGIAFANYANELTWINTPAAVQGAIIPTFLFVGGVNNNGLITCRGVDLSAVTTTLVSDGARVVFDSCKIAPAVTRLATPLTGYYSGNRVDLVNCWDGTNVVNEHYDFNGSAIADRNIYQTSGAQDDLGAYSLKLTSSSRPDKFVPVVEAFMFDVENADIGSPKVVTVEIISPSMLNSDDIRLLLEYMGTVGNPVASFVDSLPTVLTPATALPSSSAAWTVPSSLLRALSPSSYGAWSSTDIQNITLTNNNLTASTLGNSGVRGTQGVSSGKIYFECTLTAVASIGTAVGISLSSGNFGNIPSNPVGMAIVYKNGAINVNNVNTGSTIGTRSSGDVIGIAPDFDGKLIYFRVVPSGLWNGSSTANPATGVGGIPFSVLNGNFFPICGGLVAGEVITANFGASGPFVGAPPSGFNSGFAPTIKQKLQVTITPQRVGRARGLVRLGKPSTTVWVDPKLVIA